MSTQLARPDETHGAMVPITPETMAMIVSYPAMLVPPEVRDALRICWLAHRSLEGLQKSSLPIAVPMSIWIEKDGLDPKDAAAVLLRQVRLGEFGDHSFGNQLVNRIHEHCKAAVDARKKEAEAAARLAQERADREKAASPAEQQKIKDLLAGYVKQAEVPAR